MDQALGVAGTIAVQEFRDKISSASSANSWLEYNADIEVIDIKYSGSNILIIYRKEG